MTPPAVIMNHAIWKADATTATTLASKAKNKTWITLNEGSNMKQNDKEIMGTYVLSEIADLDTDRFVAIAHDRLEREFDLDWYESRDVLITACQYIAEHSADTVELFAASENVSSEERESLRTEIKGARRFRKALVAQVANYDENLDAMDIERNYWCGMTMLSYSSTLSSRDALQATINTIPTIRL
jgi:hypothetical protein